MSYDEWKTTDPEPWPSVEDDPCWSCGAAADEPCDDECECAACVQARERRRETA